MLKFLLFMYLLVNFCNASDEECGKMNHSKLPITKLKEHLLCDYDKTLRPILQHDKPTYIDSKMLIHHFDFLEHAAQLQVEAWFAMKWADEHMFWDPIDFNNIDEILLTSDDIWTPDLSVYNQASYHSNSRLIQKTAQCLVYHDKKVICVVAASINSACFPNLKYWPFDIQNCTVRIGSWLHKGEAIFLNDTEVFPDSYYPMNPEWTIESSSVKTDLGIYEGIPNSTFPTLNYNFIIKRHVHTLISVFILPILLMVMMTLLTIWLDPQSSDRIYITALTIPGHIIFLHNATWELAESGDTVPQLILTLRDSLMLASITLIETLVVRWLLAKKDDSPQWLVTAFAFLVENKAGQFLLFSELNPQNAVTNITSDDSINLVDVAPERPKEWYLLGKVIDRVLFCVYILIYVIMIMLCIPK